jgi:hypothetical protein
MMLLREGTETRHTATAHNSRRKPSKLTPVLHATGT